MLAPAATGYLLHSQPSAMFLAVQHFHAPQVFQSEVVVREFDDIMNQLKQLSMMASRFPDFDLPGKEMFLDKVR
jgi:hypothetical protein